MNYTIKDIAATKFSINDREFFKTFIAYYVDDSRIKIFNIYDSATPLIPTTPVSDIDIDGVSYTDSTLLMNALTSILYVREGTAGSLDSAQIEQNRVAIAALNQDKADAIHNHDDRYYTEDEIDAKLNDLPSGGTSITNGTVNGDDLDLKDASNTLVARINVSELRGQGVILERDNYAVRLKDESGNVLSSVSIVGDFVKIDAVDGQGNNIDKSDKWVIGSRSGINDGSPGIYYSKVPDPINNSHIDYTKFKISN